MVRFSSVLAALATVILDAASASAQQRLFAMLPDGGRAQVWEARVDNGIPSEPRLLTVLGRPGYGLGVAGGGRILIWSQLVSLSIPRATVALDRVSGWSDSLPFYSPRSLFTSWVPDPSRVRLFTVGTNPIFSVSALGTIPIPGTAGFDPFAVSVDGSRLYVTSIASGSPIVELFAIDSDTGARLAGPVTVASPRGVIPARDHHAIWLVGARPSEPDVPRLMRFDLPSGSEVLATPLPTGGAGIYSLIGVDQRRGHAFVGEAVNTGTLVHTYDAGTGALIASVRLDTPIAATLDEGAGELLVLTMAAELVTLHTISSATGQLRTSVSLGHFPSLLSVAFALPPLPPSLNPPTVSGARSVTLSWTPSPELTTHVTVEAGSGPGLANLATLAVPSGTSLTIPDVPPGTYYVRVKAANYIGDSAPSNEIVVTVP